MEHLRIMPGTGEKMLQNLVRRGDVPASPSMQPAIASHLTSCICHFCLLCRSANVNRLDCQLFHRAVALRQRAFPVAVSARDYCSFTTKPNGHGETHRVTQRRTLETNRDRVRSSPQLYRIMAHFLSGDRVERCIIDCRILLPGSTWNCLGVHLDGHRWACLGDGSTRNQRWCHVRFEAFLADVTTNSPESLTEEPLLVA